ncbi:MAG TPA: hypothetical protein VFE37_08125 [Chloroflexota bacterium]|nr:hypothetical protein [Chloroflexota bacterium]
MAEWLGAREGWGRVLGVTVYAAAMGYVEAAAVIYLRLLHGGVDPLTRVRVQPTTSLLSAEVGREVATIAMLAAVAALAGRGWAGRWGAFLLAFGTWDLAYYLFFAPLVGWPTSPLDWDVLFLIPLPWWGPVLAPALIAAAMVASGAVLLLREARGDVPALHWPLAALGIAGAALCLYAFMADAASAAGGGEAALRALRPTAFNWPLFLVGYAALAAGFLGTALAPSSAAGARGQASETTAAFSSQARPDSAPGMG